VLGGTYDVGQAGLINLRNLIFMDDDFGEPPSGSPFFLQQKSRLAPAFYLSILAKNT